MVVWPWIIALLGARLVACGKNKTQTYAIYGNVTEILYYFATIYVGTPPQQQTVILDTGSSFVGVPCKETCANHCSGLHMNSFYDGAISTSMVEERCEKNNLMSCSCSNGKCGYTQSYAEGSSYQGEYISEMVGFGQNVTQVRYSIGCHSSESGLFLTQKANGIFGLSCKGSTVRNYVDVLYEKRIIDNRIFSLCLGKNGGYITFGGYNESLNHENASIQYTSVVLGQNYEISFEEININGKAIKVSVSHTIIDSGATYSHLPYAIEEQVIQTINEYCQQHNHKCNGKRDAPSEYCYEIDSSIHTSKEFFALFPDIFLKIDGQLIPWRPSEYLVASFNDPTKYCIGIDHQVEYAILGMPFMRQKQIIFNLENKVVGYVPANCSHDINAIVRPIVYPSPKPADSDGRHKGVNTIWLVLASCLLVSSVLALMYLFRNQCLRTRPYDLVSQQTAPPVPPSIPFALVVEPNALQLPELGIVNISL